MENIVKVSREDIRELEEKYLESLSNVYDDFYEGHVIESDNYLIEYDGVKAGFFSIKGKLITRFYILDEYMHHARDLFGKVISEYGVTEGFVPTCDERYVSLSLDHSKKVDLQAYFFKLTDREVRPPEYPFHMLRRAEASDLEMIIERTGDFVDRHEERIKNGDLYILEEEGEFLGLGITTMNFFMKDYRGTGMFACENKRLTGVGRSIIMHLARIVRNQGYEPLPGCWYHNIGSRKTLESAGYASVTRLLRVGFTDK